jgi:hypothetical protein
LHASAFLVASLADCQGAVQQTIKGKYLCNLNYALVICTVICTEVFFFNQFVDFAQGPCQGASYENTKAVARLFWDDDV